MNKVIMTGNLTRDPELRVTQGGLSVARFGIAVNRPFSKDKGNTVDFFNVVAFSKQAEFVSKYFRKGQRIIIEGRLQTTSYTDKDGNIRAGTDIITDSIEFGSSKNKDASTDETPPEDYGEQVEADVPF